MKIRNGKRKTLAARGNSNGNLQISKEFAAVKFNFESFHYYGYTTYNTVTAT